MPAPFRAAADISVDVRQGQWLFASISRLVVLRTIIELERASGAEVRRETGLGTSHKILRELESRGYVISTSDKRVRFDEVIFVPALDKIGQDLGALGLWLAGKRRLLSPEVS